MIFLDESGKRWQRVKRSTVIMASLGTLPALALIGGSLAYHPQWGPLPLVQQIAAVISPNATKSQSANSGASAPKQTAKSTSKSTPNTNRQLALQTTRPNSNTSPSTTSATSATTTTTSAPTTTTTRPQSTSPTGGTSTPNSFGQTHKPVK